MNMRSLFEKIKITNINKDVPVVTTKSRYMPTTNINYRPKSNVQIYSTIVDKIANSFAEYRYHEISSNGNSRKSKLNELLNFRPNPHQTPHDFFFTIAKQRELYGNVLILPKYDVTTYLDKNGQSRKKWVLSSLNVSDSAKYEYGMGYAYESDVIYLMRRNKETMETEYIDYNEVIHIRKDPDKLFEGDVYTDLNKLTGITNVVDEQMDAYLAQLSKNGQIKGVFTIGGITGDLSTMVDTAGKQSLYSELETRIANANNGILVLDGQEKFESLTSIFETVSSDDMDRLMKLGYTLYGVSEAVVNGTASAEEMELFYRDTIKPIRDAFQEEVEYKVIGTNKYKQGIRLIAPRNPMEFSNVENLADTIYKISHLYTVNEMRENLGLPQIKDGDNLMTNLNFGLLDETPNAPKGGDNNAKKV